MLETREMSMEDIDSIYEIECESFNDPWSKEALRYEIELESAINRVVLVDKKVVGYAGLRKVFDEGHITNIAVNRKYQGEGLGTQLMEELIAVSRDKGIKSFTLEVRVSNQSAIKLYEKLGFEKLGERKNYYEKPAEDALIMWK